jgi:hypothetical protein
VLIDDRLEYYERAQDAATKKNAKILILNGSTVTSFTQTGFYYNIIFIYLFLF